jgi:hemerythrin superfamily protein
MATNKQSGNNKTKGGTVGTSSSASKTKPSTPTGPMAGIAPLVQQAQAPGSMESAIDALKQDHRKVEQLFSQFEASNDEQAKSRLIRQICSELIIHTKLEEEIFYRACRDAGCGEDIMDEAQVEHDGAKLLIADLAEAEPDEPFVDAKVSVLSEQIKHHVAEEEKAGEGIFAQAKEHGVDTPELARRLAQRKQELQGRAADLRPTRAVSFNLDFVRVMEESMPRYSNRSRDERGRFTDDDDDDRSGRGRRHGGWFSDPRGHSEAARGRWERSSRSSSRYDDDDDDRGGYRGNDRERDERGRFMSDDDHGYRSRSRYDDDDADRGDYRGNDRERDERGRFMSDDDNRGYRSRSRYDDDDHDRGGYRERDERGRFMSDDDERGYRSHGRYEDDDDDRGGRGRGHGGWFGDSEGHSEAARRGRSSGSRSRYDEDDDDRRGRGGGHGGWFGDSRGHAQAARRGWRERR